jgi:response regulator RpfG family c-di-GMP phosphodiesterase
MATRSSSLTDSVRTPSPLPHLLRKLLASSIIPAGDWDVLPSEKRESILIAPDDDNLLNALLAEQLLTPFQVGRLRGNEAHTLVLGNYRILEKIGAGGMGVVFRAEHVKLRKPVAVKALFIDGEKNRRALDRFFNEVLAVTRLKHPHIVAAVDAGEQPGAGPNGAPVPYLVMEYVAGRNLEDVVARDGPMKLEQACLAAHQVADALTEAHRQGLIHRDIKPGNVLLTADGTAKLLDFGVARLPTPDDRLTKDGARLGTIGYMAPEQVRNARGVDARADVFGLGATLFFMLTGRDPFDPPVGSAGALAPPAAREFRSDVPASLDGVMAKLMALNPADRVPTAEAAMREMLPFLRSITRPSGKSAPDMNGQPDALIDTTPDGVPDAAPVPHQILIVDDQIDVRRVCKLALAGDGARCEEVGNGNDALAKVRETDYDLVLLDVDLPGINGEQVLRKIRQTPPSPHIKVIMLSGRTSGDELSRMLNAGADDFLTKPFSLVQLRARVKAALKLKDAQDRSETLNGHLMTLNQELERNVSSRDSELVHARGAMVLALAKLVEQRSAETGAHLIRLQKYCRVLGEAARKTPPYAERLTPDFLQVVEDAAPLHDIGKAAVPDYILNKPGRLDPHERVLMEAHTTNGSETLQEVARKYKFATGFLQMAVDIARHHHEKWDGSGYPDKLSGEEIPLAARLLAICDVYDALRSRRVYKPSLSHNMALMTMVDASPGHFDPGLMMVFRNVADKFDEIYRETAE